MSNRNEQNGRQPPLPTQPASCGSEYNGENFITNDRIEICKDFVWGICNKRAKCKFRHELDFEAMKRILVFCHDYQNKSRCMRENCTYLHATKEEENLFLETGQLPRVLVERHSNMSALAAETIPQIALFIQESFIAPPPPPPPPPVPSGAPAPPLPAPAPIPGPFVAHRPTCHPLQQMPPPPPPPTVPSAPVMYPWNSLYTGPQHNMAIASTSTASPSFPVFYGRPPPPLVQMRNGTQKRKAPESDGPSHPHTPTASTSTASTSSFPIFDATKPPPPIQGKNGLPKWKPPEPDAHHSKMKKKEEDNVADAQCEQCKRRCVRLEEYKQDLEKLQREDEYQSLIYRRKLEDLQNRKEELKSHVSPELFSCINEYIENLPIPHVQDTYPPVFNADRSTTVPRQFLIQLMDFILNADRHFDSSSTNNLQRDESLLQMLTQRTSPQNADVLQLIMDILRQCNS